MGRAPRCRSAAPSRADPRRGDPSAPRASGRPGDTNDSWDRVRGRGRSRGRHARSLRPLARQHAGPAEVLFVDRICTLGPERMERSAAPSRSQPGVDRSSTRPGGVECLRWRSSGSTSAGRSPTRCCSRTAACTRQRCRPRPRRSDPSSRRRGSCSRRRERRRSSGSHTGRRSRRTRCSSEEAPAPLSSRPGASSICCISGARTVRASTVSTSTTPNPWSPWNAVSGRTSGSGRTACSRPSTSRACRRSMRRRSPCACSSPSGTGRTSGRLPRRCAAGTPVRTSSRRTRSRRSSASTSGRRPRRSTPTWGLSRPATSAHSRRRRRTPGCRRRS